MATEIYLPRAEDAEIPVGKLRDYALDADHLRGRHKARVFASALGIYGDDWEYLHDQILDRLPLSPVTAIRPHPPWGVGYEVRVQIDGLNGASHPVITGWLIRAEGPPEMVTTYVDV